MEWKKDEVDRSVHPKKESGAFANAYSVEGFDVTVCCDDELSDAEVTAIAERAAKYHEPIRWVEVYVDGEELECGFHTSEPQTFERIRRITGYLVGTLDRFNNGKRAEEADRVKHDVSAQG